MYKLKLKSCHEVIDTVSVTDVDSIFYGKPTGPSDILTILMTNGKRLYCDEVCPVDFLQEGSVSEDLEEEISRYLLRNDVVNHSESNLKSYAANIARHFANWQREQMMKEAWREGK